MRFTCSADILDEPLRNIVNVVTGERSCWPVLIICIEYCFDNLPSWTQVTRWCTNPVAIGLLTSAEFKRFHKRFILWDCSTNVCFTTSNVDKSHWVNPILFSLPCDFSQISHHWNLLLLIYFDCSCLVEIKIPNTIFELFERLLQKLEGQVESETKQFSDQRSVCSVYLIFKLTKLSCLHKHMMMATLHQMLIQDTILYIYIYI